MGPAGLLAGAAAAKGGLFSPSQGRLQTTEPRLRRGALGVLEGAFGGTGMPGLSDISGRLNKTFNLPGTALQQQGLGIFANLLNQPTAAQRAFEAQGGATGQFGQDILNAYNPIYERNLGNQIASVYNQGPRFSSGAQLQADRLREQALQDYNLFAKQTLESGRARQIQAAIAADQSQQALLSGAGQFATQANAPNLQLLSYLLPYLFQGGLSQGVTVGPSIFGQLAQAASAIAGAVAGHPGNAAITPTTTTTTPRPNDYGGVPQ